MESWVKFCSPQNISGASQQTALQHSPKQMKKMGSPSKLILKDVIYTLNMQSC